jgi:hypothetical protein
MTPQLTLRQEDMAKKRSRWTKRKLFTVKFKGREPRQLLWRKGVYEEWFRYALLHQTRGGKIPKEFGNLKKFKNFEEWWRHPKYGFELCCEPPLESVAVVLGPKDQIRAENDEVLLKINLRCDPDILEAEIKRLVKSLEIGDDYQSRARFQPSRPMQRIRLAEKDERGATGLGNLKQFRETFELTEKMKHRDVAQKLGWLRLQESDFLHQNGGNKIETKKDYEKYVKGVLRRIERHRKFVFDAFRSIEKGTFP